MTDLSRAPAREPGFYWVRLANEWRVATWILGGWYCQGGPPPGGSVFNGYWQYIGPFDGYWQDIGPRILSPGESAAAALDTVEALSAEHERKMSVLRAERDELREALRQLHHECVQAGFKDATDYNWPKAMMDAEALLAKVSPP